MNHNFEACCCHKKVCIRTEVWESAVISQTNRWHEKTLLLFIMCMEALLSKDEMSAHKGFCSHMTSASIEVYTLQAIVLVSDMVLGLLPIE